MIVNYDEVRVVYLTAGDDLTLVIFSLEGTTPNEPEVHMKLLATPGCFCGGAFVFRGGFYFPFHTTLTFVEWVFVWLEVGYAINTFMYVRHHFITCMPKPLMPELIFRRDGHGSDLWCVIGPILYIIEFLFGIPQSVDHMKRELCFSQTCSGIESNMACASDGVTVLFPCSEVIVM